MNDNAQPADWILAEISAPSGERVGYLRKRQQAPPEPRHDRRLWLTLHFVPKANHMPASEDLEIFEKVETDIEESLEVPGLADIVAVFTVESKRDYLIYFSDSEKILGELSRVVGPYFRLAPMIEEAPDPDWVEFHSLMG